MIEPRTILVYLSIKYNGDWNKIYSCITRKETINYEELENFDLNVVESKFITIFDEEYPECFRMVHHPPFVIYYHGDISLLKRDGKTLSVIGSRECSDYSIEQTKIIVSDLPDDYVIVSGLAKGIDAIAHEAAIESNKKTIAVLGSGINYCYPLDNIYLYKEIKENHLIISEHPNYAEPLPWQFPHRNRLVAALGQGLLVIEAHQKSGTYFTIEYALGMGKTVMCIPTRIGEESICNKIIKQGAYLVENSNDIGVCLDKSFY